MPEVRRLGPASPGRCWRARSSPCWPQPWACSPAARRSRSAPCCSGTSSARPSCPWCSGNPASATGHPPVSPPPSSTQAPSSSSPFWRAALYSSVTPRSSPPPLPGCSSSATPTEPTIEQRQQPTGCCLCGPLRTRLANTCRRWLPAVAARRAYHDAAARDRDEPVAQVVVVGPVLLDDGFPVDRPLHRCWQRLLWGRRRDGCHASTDGSGRG